MTTKQGGAAEFLTGGKLSDAVGAVADMMAIAEATSDPIESFFGIHDSVAASQSQNTSFHVTGVLATWKHNDTSFFLRNLSDTQRVTLLREGVRHARRLKRETDQSISESAAYKLKRLEKQAKATRASEKALIHELMNLRHQTLFKTTAQYKSFCDGVLHDYKKILKELKMQIRLLIKVGPTTNNICIV